MRAKRSLKRNNRALKYGSLALAGAAVATGGVGTASQVHAATQNSNGQPSIHSQASNSVKNIASQSSAGSSSESSSNSKQQASAGNNRRQSAVQNVDPQFGPLAGHPDAQIIYVTYGYEIQSGDNLPSIAAVHHVSQQSIMNDNPGVDFDHMIAGTQLRIPRTAATNHRLGFMFTGNGLVVNARSSRPPKNATLQFGSLGDNQSGTSSEARVGAEQGQRVASQTSSSASQSTNGTVNWNSLNSSIQQSNSSQAESSDNIPQKTTTDNTPQPTNDVHQLRSVSGVPTQTIAEHNTAAVHESYNPVGNTTYHINRAHTSPITRVQYQPARQEQPAARQSVNVPTQQATTQYANNGSIVPHLDPQQTWSRAYIVRRESGGNYNARNGAMIGKYQLTDTYLHGDYSPANQERTAQRYVTQRYGNWNNAQHFWAGHHWY